MPEDLELLAIIERHRKPKRKRTESNLLHRILAKAERLGFRLWRNQVGSYRLHDGRWLTSGLCVGSSDLIGYRRVTITTDMVGTQVAVFAAVEVKSATGRASPKQLAFLTRVNADGGLILVARSEQDLEAL